MITPNHKSGRTDLRWIKELPFKQQFYAILVLCAWNFKLLKHEEIMILMLLIFQVIYIYTCGQINQTENDHTLCEDAYFWR